MNTRGVFRGKRPEADRENVYPDVIWVEGGLLPSSKEDGPDRYIWDNDYGGPIRVLANTIGMKTNYKDRNGVEVFEGDTLRNIVEGFTWSVTWCFHCNTFEASTKKALDDDFYDVETGSIPTYYYRDSIVTGTVHDRR